MIEGSRITYLDGWRGLAILTVLAGHFGHFVPQLGNLGVELFFVLSGRLMAQILFEKRTPLPTFFQRRFSRVYPALAVYVLVMSALALTVNRGRGVDALSIATSLTFTINYMPALGHDLAGAVEHIWSLCVEEHCYALLALIGVVTGRRIGMVRPICFAFAGAAMLNGLRLYLGGAGGVHEIYWRTDVRLAPVFLSVALYLSKPGKFGFPALVLSFPLFLVLPLPLRFIIPTGMLAYSVNSIGRSEWAKFLSHPALVWIGTISYSLYLWQQPFYQLGHGKAFGMVPAFVMAVLSYKVVEVPARAAINRLTLFSPAALSAGKP